MSNCDLVCERLSEQSGHGQLILTREAFIRMCRSSYRAAHAGNRVSGPLRLCKNCRLGKENSENGEWYPTNICFSDDTQE